MERITRVGKSTSGAFDGFKTFILRGNVVDLAIGIVIGVAFGAVVTAFVSDIITPLIPAPGGSLATWMVIVPYTGKPMLIGTFINAIISFVIIAAVIYYFVVLPVNKLTAHFKPQDVEVAPTTQTCPYCRTTIPVDAVRCPNCTSQFLPTGDSVAGSK